MIEYTPDQLLFVESFTTKRDSLTLEVGLLTHEKEQLIEHNRNISELNANLQQGIDEMNNKSASLGFEQAEKIASLKKQVTDLESDIEVLLQKKDLLVKDTEEKNNTLINLGLLINSIKTSTEDTVEHIKKITGVLNVYTGKVEITANVVEGEANKIKSYVNELSTTVDQERKENYRRTKEIDDRENAVIGREKMVELKYAKAVKELK